MYTRLIEVDIEINAVPVLDDDIMELYNLKPGSGQWADDPLTPPKSIFTGRLRQNYCIPQSFRSDDYRPVEMNRNERGWMVVVFGVSRREQPSPIVCTHIRVKTIGGANMSAGGSPVDVLSLEDEAKQKRKEVSSIAQQNAKNAVAADAAAPAAAAPTAAAAAAAAAATPAATPAAAAAAATTQKRKKLDSVPFSSEPSDKKGKHENAQNAVAADAAAPAATAPTAADAAATAAAAAIPAAAPAPVAAPVAAAAPAPAPAAAAAAAAATPAEPSPSGPSDTKGKHEQQMIQCSRCRKYRNMDGEVSAERERERERERDIHKHVHTQIYTNQDAVKADYVTAGGDEGKVAFVCIDPSECLQPCTYCIMKQKDSTIAACDCCPIPDKAAISSTMIAWATKENSGPTGSAYTKIVEEALKLVPVHGKRGKTPDQDSINDFWTKLHIDLHCQNYPPTV